MRILITGCKGMVGTTLRKVLGKEDLILTDKEELDVTNYDQCMRYVSQRPEFIVHLAAETDLEFCEKDKNQAYTTNAIGCQNIKLLAEELDVPLLYLSTAGVFDGTKNRPYTPHDRPNPVNVYGRSKYYGEVYIQEYWKHYIIRASWMIGGGPDVDKKFVNKIINKIKSGHKEIKVCNDVFGSPTYTLHLCQNIKDFIKGEFSYGLYHCAGLGSATRYDVAREIVKELKEEHNVDIIPVSSDDVWGEFPCARSKNEVLINSKGIQMIDWKESLKEYINAYYRN